MRTVLPISTPSNRRATPAPTISSRKPGVKRRPSTIFSCGRSSNDAGSTPRSVTFAPLTVSPFFISSVITISSPDASGLPSLPLRMPGPSRIRFALSPPKPELSSAPEPPRSTIALSSRPASCKVAWKPCAIASKAVNTATTPARPMMMTSDGPQRCGTLRRFKPVIAKIWLSM